MSVISAALLLHFKSEDACDEFIGDPPFVRNGNPESFRHFIHFASKWYIIQHVSFPIKDNNPNACLISVVLESDIVPKDIVDVLEALINTYEDVDGVYLCFYTVNVEYSGAIPVCGSFTWESPSNTMIYKELEVPAREPIYTPSNSVYSYMGHCVALLSTYHTNNRGYTIPLPQRTIHDDPTEIKI